MQPRALAGVSRWDDHDRLAAIARWWSVFLAQGIATVALITAAAFAAGVLLDTGAVARASFMAARAYIQEWPLCVQEWPKIPKPFDPRRVPI